MWYIFLFFFFFQAEDGIRDLYVTGVQTCALPIYLYGTAVTGGSGSCEGGCGVAYKLTNSGGVWTQTVIHAFTGGDDGSGPGARLTVDQSGNIYGMAPTGGAYGSGTIYKIHQGHGGAWNLKV